MTSDEEFTRRLIGFGLSEKEAQLYLYLLQYGQNTPSPLAKSLKTYREDVHRALNSLNEKGMVRASLDARRSTPLWTSIQRLSLLRKSRRGELREMEARKWELQELLKEQKFRPSDEVATFKIIKSVKEVLTVSIASVIRTFGFGLVERTSLKLLKTCIEERYGFRPLKKGIARQIRTDELPHLKIFFFCDSFVV